MMLPNNSPLFADLVSASDVASYKEKIDEVERQLFKVKNEPGEAISNMFSEQVYQSIMNGMKEAGVDSKDPVAVSGYLREVEEAVSKLPVVDVRLAFQPVRAQLRMIGSMIEEVFGGRAILNIEVETDLIGGAIISYQGKMYDYSLKSRLRGYFS